MLKANRLVDSWLAFALIASCFTGLTLWPFIFNEFLGLADYANHLARLHLLTGHAQSGWEEYYYIDHAIVPNLALDIIAALFVECGLSPGVALRVFVALANLLVVFGVIYISSRANDGRPPWLALWAFPIAFNRYFIWGFLNYYFAVGVGLFVFGLWVYGKRRRGGTLSFVDQASLSVALVFIMFGHLMGYAVTLLCMGLHTLSEMLRAQHGLRGAIRCAASGLLVILPSVLAYVFVCDHSASDYPIVYLDTLYSKLAGLASPFFAYDLRLAALAAVAFVASVLVAVAGKNKTFKDMALGAYSRSAWFVIVGLFIVFLLAPAGMMNSYFLDKRLFSPVSFVALGLLACRLNIPRASVITLLAFASHLLIVVSVHDVWQVHSRSMREIRSALERVELGSKIVGISFGDTHRMPIPPLQHAVTMAVYTRAAFVPSLFARPINAESVAFRDTYDYNPRVQDARDYSLPAQEMAHLFDSIDQYDYALVTHANQVPSIPGDLRMLAEGEHFRLFELAGK